MIQAWFNLHFLVFPKFYPEKMIPQSRDLSTIFHPNLAEFCHSYPLFWRNNVSEVNSLPSKLVFSVLLSDTPTPVRASDHPYIFSITVCSLLSTKPAGPRQRDQRRES